jgi:hypothetical protein
VGVLGDGFWKQQKIPQEADWLVSGRRHVGIHYSYGLTLALYIPSSMLDNTSIGYKKGTMIFDFFGLILIEGTVEISVLPDTAELLFIFR